MPGKKVVVVGTSFAGFTAAIELKERLGENHEIVVLAPSPEFVFIPSLIWVPFGLRTREDISFDVRPAYEEKGVHFVETAALAFDLEGRNVRTTNGDVAYDYLVIATGPKPNFDVIPGLGPSKHTVSICTYDHAMEAKHAWDRLLDDPGPVVIGAIQGAACFGAAYEFIFNCRYQLKKKKVIDRAPMTFVTAEPFLSHFGIGGFGNAQTMSEKMFKSYGIQWHTNAVVREVTQNGVVLDSGEEIPAKYTMLIPPFQGVDAVRETPGLANKAGFIEVGDDYRHPQHQNVYAVGVAVHVAPPAPTPVPCGVPKTGYPSEQMAKIAASNIAVDILGEGERKTLPFGEIKAMCVMDTGNMGMMILGDHMLSPRGQEMIIPGPQAHWAKIGFEKYFLATRKRGHV